VLIRSASTSDWTLGGAGEGGFVAALRDDRFLTGKPASQAILTNFPLDLQASLYKRLIFSPALAEGAYVLVRMG
jgi:hypothetical protein